MEGPSALSRMHFPEEEKKFSWLPLLLDAYGIIDDGIRAAISGEELKRGARPACGQGCSVCCSALKDIPIYPIEIVGLYWYATEKLKEPARALLKERLSGRNSDDACPFLIEGSCSVYLIRPTACRQFNVFTRPCSEGEDPYYTRRDDVLTPIKEYTDRAFYVTLPFYGVKSEEEKEAVIKNNLIHTQVQVIGACNWKELAKLMDDFDSRKR